MNEGTIAAIVGGGFALLNIVVSALNAYRATRQGAQIKREETSFEQLSKIYTETREELKTYSAEAREKDVLLDKKDAEIDELTERIREFEASQTKTGETR
ncbi:MAG: hypothetical protein HC933_16095 [Pleurocapsa sp. SU_196_0]|nr:hypothetical protein [Pleurocapsa sp. SU_196_0]